MYVSKSSSQRPREHQPSEIYYPLKDGRIRDWLAVTPIANLEIDRDHLPSGEIGVVGVTLMDLKHFTYVAKRRWGKAGATLKSGLETFLRHYEKAGTTTPAIRTVALQRKRRPGRLLEEEFHNDVRCALAILASTFWTYKERDPLSAFGTLEYASRGQRIWFLQNTQHPFRHAPFSMSWTKGLIPARIDNFWRTAEKRYKFLRLINTFFSKNSPASDGWKTSVRQAFRLFGEGFFERDAQQAAFANMVALDLLLFESQEREQRKIELLDALLRWIRMYDPPGPSWAQESELKRLFKIRNDIAHRGETSELSVGDLLLSDDIIGNLLLLIVRNQGKFCTKEKLRDFAREELARKCLGQKPPYEFVKRNRPVNHTWASNQKAKARVAARLFGLKS